jgi:RNA polymerase sigma-70 factor (ECF subfamily)
MASQGKREGLRARLRRNFSRAAALTEMSTPVDSTADPDVQLMLAVQRGQHSAFQELFQKHIAGVVRFAAQFVGGTARAEELAQDVFLQIFRTRARYVPTARFRTWLYRMVANACLSEVRRVEYRGRVQSLDQLPGAGGDTSSVVGPPTRSSEEIVLDREALERMCAVLRELPAQQRAALLLARVEGLSYEEVAASLSCSVSAVKSLVHRATVTLRDRMGREGE